MKKQIYSIAVVASVLISSMASADVDVDKISEDTVVISYSSTEAATLSGRNELISEVRRAAEKVCGPQSLGQAGSLTEMLENRACFDRAVAKALTTIGQTV